MDSNAKTENEQYSPLTKRLDVIIRLLLELYKNNNQAISKEEVVKLLNTTGLTPTEIAKILGKKSRTSIAGLLYRKNRKKK